MLAILEMWYQQTRFKITASLDACMREEQHSTTHFLGSKGEKPEDIHHTIKRQHGNTHMCCLKVVGIILKSDKESYFYILCSLKKNTVLLSDSLPYFKIC